jgi:uncharacterized RDD family membrane protein YckC
MYPAGSVPASSTVGVGYRLLALIIDGIVLLIVTCPLSIIAFLANDGDSTEFSGVGTAMNGIAFIVTLLYFAGMEATRGATVGKMALGLRVVKTDGSMPDWGSTIVRNLLRIVDMFPYFIPYLVGAILVWTSPTRQRLGDRVAGTMVVRKDAVPEITGFESQRF